MPELPEVEVLRLALLPHLEQQVLHEVTCRRDLRYPVPLEYPLGSRLQGLHRRGKYLFWDFGSARYLLHLGMSGRVRTVHPESLWRKHEHIQWDFQDVSLRFEDPRRFGFWIRECEDHQWLWQGLDALGGTFETWLPRLAQKKRAIHAMLLDQKVLLGIGNIYMQEALFEAKIHPLSQDLSAEALRGLYDAVQKVLQAALQSGGSTFRDHRLLSGEEGRFQHAWQVYQRQGQACVRCGQLLQRLEQKRSLVFCPGCQVLLKSASM